MIIICFTGYYAGMVASSLFVGRFVGGYVNQLLVNRKVRFFLGRLQRIYFTVSSYVSKFCSIPLKTSMMSVAKFLSTRTFDCLAKAFGSLVMSRHDNIMQLMFQ